MNMVQMATMETQIGYMTIKSGGDLQGKQSIGTLDSNSDL